MEKETNKFHALQLFTDTFTAETVHLTNNKIGIYIRLLSFAWTKNAKAFTTESAFRICQCMNDQCCIDVYEVLEEFFKVERECDDRNKKTWYHKRLVQEHQYLSEKYKRKSNAGKKGMEIRYSSVNNKTITPIPNPIPIPNKNKDGYHESFETLWKSLKVKRGSKFKAYKLWQKLENDMPDIDQTSFVYNKQTQNIEKKFIPHFATWLSERRWEIEDDTEDALKSVITRLINLGFTHIGRESNYEKFTKDGKKFKIDVFDEKNMILPDE
jgi:uncharacterized protein YdaU (DUF1376 family)